MYKRSFLSAGLFLLLALALPAYGAARKVALTQVFASSNCTVAGERPELRYLPDADAARDWLQIHMLGPIGSQLAVYVPPGLAFAALSMGNRATGGYGVMVQHTAILTGEGVLLLQTQWATPAAGNTPLQLPTSPCVLVGFPKRHYSRLRAVDQHGRVRVSAEPSRR